MRRLIYGLSGLGDLLLTSTSVKSRNFSLGVALGQGIRLDKVLADRMADQPAIAGDVLMDDVIWPIVDALVSFANQIAPSMGSVIDFKIPIDNIIGPSMELAQTLSQLKSSHKDSPKSTTVFVGNPKGPSV